MYIGTLRLGIIYLVAAFVLLVLGKYCFDLMHRSFIVKEEFIDRDNVALELVLCGYLMGLMLAVGGALAGPSISLMQPTSVIVVLADKLIYHPRRLPTYAGPLACTTTTRLPCVPLHT